MKDKHFNLPANAVLVQDFEIETTQEQLTEEQLFDLLCERITWMIEYKMEYLLSLLYRNDVLEEKINFALSPLCPDPANIALTKLVLARQKERMAIKQSFKVEPIEGLEEGLKF